MRNKKNTFATFITDPLFQYGLFTTKNLVTLRTTLYKIKLHTEKTAASLRRANKTVRLYRKRTNDIASLPPKGGHVH